jgi:plasmid stabilization system protein ParE
LAPKPRNSESFAETKATPRLRTLDFTDEALADLSAVETWLTQPGAGQRARQRLERIIAALEGLREHPCRHQQTGTGRREFTVEGYRVRYRVKPDTGRNATAGNVLVLRVFGPYQNRSRD